MKSKTLSFSTLKEKGACADQRSEFRRLFGNSVEITPELCRSVAPLFDWDWAARNLLSAPARAAYKEACAVARAAYGEACAPARAAYKEACALAWAVAYVEGE